MRILYVSGSSAGHLAPLIAVERAVVQQDAKAESLFVCSQVKDDASFLEKEHVHYQALPLPRHPLRHPVRILQSLRSAKAIIDTFQPNAIFSKGGIVSIPLCFIAYRKKIPIILHESDAVMGRANKVVARWATKVCVGFPMKNTSYEDDKLRATSKVEKSRSSQLVARSYIITGNPLRPNITSGSKIEGLRITGLSGNRPILLITGGSQGARALNDAVTNNIDALLSYVDIIHLTGRGKKTIIQRKGYWQSEFVHDELAHLYAIADIAISRAGAGAISELAANAIATILVPIEGLANNHQFLNAITAQENGRCIILLQSELKKKLPALISDLSKNSERRNQISQGMQSLTKADAAGHIARIIFECIAQKAMNL